MFIAPNKNEFHQLFIDKLHRMLSPEEPGAFILALANSMQDEATRSDLKDELTNMFSKLRGAMDEKLLCAAPDDLEVFRQLVETGIDNYSAWVHIDKGGWVQYFNPLRTLRPKRASAEHLDDIKKEFNPNCFNFNKPFLKPEIFWEGSVVSGSENIDCTVLYNKFPFLPYHFLFVPEAESCHSQYLTKRFHQLAWDVCVQSQNSLNGIGFGYNSMGACASVNHMHFQGFLFEDLFPIENANWIHNGGDEMYPMSCSLYQDADQAWQYIESLHGSNQPYNMLYRPASCYVLLRKMQGSESVHKRVSGAGWIEACGIFSEAKQGALTDFNADDLFADIASLSA